MKSFFIICISIFGCFANAKNCDDLIGVLKQVKENLIKRPIDYPGETVVAQSLVTHPNNLKSALTGLLAIHRNNSLNNESLELLWWEHTSSDVRKCILLIYYCKNKMYVDNVAPFEVYAKRFNTEEAKQRIEEIQEVWTNYQRLKKDIDVILM